MNDEQIRSIRTSSFIAPPSYSFLCAFDLKRQFRVDVAAVVAGGVRQLGRAALRTADIVNRPQRLMRAAFALPRFGNPLYRQHKKPTAGISPPLHWGWYVMD